MDQKSSTSNGDIATTQHWAEGMHESVLSVSPKSDSIFTIGGGAEHGLFPIVENLRIEKLSYLRGEEKLRDDEIVLEVQDKKVAGLTAPDVFDWLSTCCQAGGPLALKTVRPGFLTKDLRQYLSMRFPKGSIDHDLQNTIRDNVYLKTVPCTTREPRPGEVNGVDYRFVSEEEFNILEANGELLESGVYEGNNYGTPKPRIESVPGTSSVEESPARNSEQSHLSSEVFESTHLPTVTSPVRRILREPPPPHSSVMPALYGHNSETTPTKPPPPHHPSPPTINGYGNGHGNGNGVDGGDSDPLGPIPPNWEIAYTDYGEKYFIDHNSGTTHWTDPRLPPASVDQGPTPVSESIASTSAEILPPGWEKVEDPQYGPYYVDHINRRTQYEKPSFTNGMNGAIPESIKRRVNSVPELSAVLTRPQRHQQKVHRNFFTRDPNELGGEFISTRVLKGPRGLGFTLIGNDAGSPVEEFLQIKSIIPGGPAAADGVLRMGDVLVYINDACVLGSTQEDAIHLFQAIPVGHSVNLQICRGYPLLFDPTDEIIVQEAYSPSNSQTQNSVQQNQLPPPHPSQQQQRLSPGDSGTGGPLRAAEMLRVTIEKGDMGFGFTIADGPYGQRVKKIMDKPRCMMRLEEGDILCEINGINVRKMSHADIVDVLRDCPVGQRAEILIQRTGMRSSGSSNAALPPAVPAKPTRPHSFHPAMGNQAMNDRRSKTPTSEYQQQAAFDQQKGGHVVPSLKPRSRTPGPQPPRPSKPNGYLPRQQGRIPVMPAASIQTSSLYAEENPIYENLHKQKERSKSPGILNLQGQMGQQSQRARTPVGIGGFATPNYVPASVYSDRYGSGRPNGTEPLLERSFSSLQQGPGGIYYDILTVNLIRHPQGFGFRVVGGTEEGRAVMVGQIVEGGAADQDGRLGVGDEIVDIDGHYVLGGAHSNAVDLMHRAAEQGHVKLVIRRPVKEMPRSISMPLPSAMPNRPPAYPYDVTVVRRENEGFGFVIISSVNKNGSTIGRIIEGSPAARCGELGVGDRIVAVNGINILTMHHGDIVNLIKDSGLSVTLTVGSPDDLSTPTPTNTTGGMINHIGPTLNGPVPLERQESLGSVLEAIESAGHERYSEMDEYRDINVSDPPTPTDRLHLHHPTQEFFGTYIPPAIPQSGGNEEVFSVELHRGSRGFGFSIRGGTEFGQDLFVLRIAEGGPAHLDGRLRVGDKLVEIDGASTEGMTHERAIQLIKGGASVHLLVRRENFPIPIGSQSSADTTYARSPANPAMAEAIQASWSRNG